MKTDILVESWKNFIKEQDEVDPITLPMRREPERFSVGLVPMSAKPFHKGHMFLIQAAAEKCDRVIVYVSISDYLCICFPFLIVCVSLYVIVVVFKVCMPRCLHVCMSACFLL